MIKSMHSKIFAFALGVACVFLIRDLPSVAYPIGIMAISALMAIKFKSLWMVFTFFGGFLWLHIHSSSVMDHWLEPELENRLLLVSGQVDNIPQIRHSNTFGKNRRSQRFVFTVDCVQALPRNFSKKRIKYRRKHTQAYFNQALTDSDWSNTFCEPGVDKFLLDWHDKKINLKPGQHWLFLVKAKRPHGYANPGSFDYEKWLFQKGISATGSVKNYLSGHLLSRSLKIPDDNFLTYLNNNLAWLKTRINYQRWLISEKINNQFANKEYAALVSALVVGDKREINDHQNDVLQRTGTSHLLAVSGLHIGLFAGVVYFLMSKIINTFSLIQVYFSSRKLAMFAALLAAFVYSGLAGFSTPTVRALIMLATFCWYLFRDRQGSVWDAFFWALFWILLLNPLSILSIGFWLSFLAVFSILLVITGRLVYSDSEPQEAETSSKLSDPDLNSNFLSSQFFRIKKNSTGLFKIPKLKLKSWISLQFAVFAGLLPLSILFFAQVSLIAPLVNLIVIPIFAWSIVPLSLIGGLSLPISPSFAAFILRPVEWITDKVWHLIEHFSGYSMALKSISSGDYLLLIPLVLIAGFLFLTPRGLPFRWLALVFALPLITAFLPISAKSFSDAKPVYNSLGLLKDLEKGEFKFTILDVGQGLSAVIQTQNHTLVYDVGNSSAGKMVVRPFLKDKGIKDIDLLLLSHDDSDHTGGLESLRDYFTITKLMAPPKVFNSLNRNKNFMLYSSLANINCNEGQYWQWDGVHFFAISPAETSKTSVTPPKTKKLKDNDQSCILKIWNEKVSILLPGDLEIKGEKLLLDHISFKLKESLGQSYSPGEIDQLKVNLKADILVAPHHGSKSSTSFAFLEAVSPSQVVFAVGYLNHFGHPHSLIKERYKSINAKAFNTALVGAIEYDFRLNTEELTPTLYRINHGRIWNPL